MTWLPWSIDQQLRRDANLGMVEYQALAMLSKNPQRTMRMGALAVVTNASMSRLSHNPPPAGPRRKPHARSRPTSVW